MPQGMTNTTYSLLTIIISPEVTLCGWRSYKPSINKQSILTLPKKEAKQATASSMYGYTDHRRRGALHFNGFFFFFFSLASDYTGRPVVAMPEAVLHRPLMIIQSLILIQ